LSKHLHIVSLDAPAPPNYGGAIDMYYKITSLSDIGINITLHYFNYRNDRNIKDLEPYCSNIIAYKRKTGLGGISLLKPYIVSSRINQQLIDNLNSNDYPVLLEGLHCTGIIPFLKNQKRRIMIRVHNDESTYYKMLAESEGNWVKKAYYFTESTLLQSYQYHLPHFCTYAFISENDKLLFQKKYGITNSYSIPAFIPWQKVESLEGCGSYMLYHGNLSVPENEYAAIWLIKEVMPNLNYPLIIAGKNAIKKLQKLATGYHNIFLVNSPSDDELDSLIQNAHIHLLPSFNQTGVKLKLLNVLFNGRYCITNKMEVQGSPLEKMVRTAENAQDYTTIINSLMQQPFEKQYLASRQELVHLYNNLSNAQKMSELLYNTHII
jgi:glycosyltransferase involved in cell wall biosynthesis